LLWGYVAQMAYMHRYASRRRPARSAELLYLVIVLAAGVATAWWAGHRVGMNLSSITTVAAALGFNERIGTSRPVGYAAASVDRSTAGPAAPYCNPGQALSFDARLLELKQRLGDTMGTPLECGHPGDAVSDTIEQTSTGLAEFNELTSTASFTDGWRHWAVTPRGFVAWEGSQSGPPGD
jgi:hypothetical protein